MSKRKSTVTIMTAHASILAHLTALYGEAAGNNAFERLRVILKKYRPRLRRGSERNVSERDAILITYGDQLRESRVPPLRALAGICEKRLIGLLSGVHILRFFSYSSDDGFSVMDYRTVNPDFGAWEDVE